MNSKYILYVIIFSQFAGTSLWFAGNSILPDLIAEYGFSTSDLGLVTSAVQLGFIFGTLSFAITAISDRYSPSRIFFICSCLGALFNVIVLLIPTTLFTVLASRFLTGFMLAGIYPIGMKISADWYKDSLGKAIGYLVGALVLGTAFPNLIKAVGGTLEWKMVLIWVSALSLAGGLAMLFFVKDGPHRKKMSHFDPLAIKELFRPGKFRSSTFGYFGHMWELYTFWAFLPLIITRFNFLQQENLNVYFWTFIFISVGFFGSGIGGEWSLKIGSGKVAWYNLLISGLCVLLLPLMIMAPVWLFIFYMIIWGWAVVGDSPQFSALAASNAPKDLVGSGLTIMNCIGFSLTILSISVLNYSLGYLDLEYAFLLLIPGPVFGLVSINSLK